MSELSNDQFNLSSETQKESLDTPEKKDYDIPAEREKKRGQIALFLIWILAGIIAISLLIVMFSCKPTVENLKSILELIFTPIIALVGAATGFYFGEKHK